MWLLLRSKSVGAGEERVLRWCGYCGTCKDETLVDNRRMGVLWHIPACLQAEAKHQELLGAAGPVQHAENLACRVAELEAQVAELQQRNDYLAVGNSEWLCRVQRAEAQVAALRAGLEWLRSMGVFVTNILGKRMGDGVGLRLANNSWVYGRRREEAIPREELGSVDDFYIGLECAIGKIGIGLTPATSQSPAAQEPEPQADAGGECPASALEHALDLFDENPEWLRSMQEIADDEEREVMPRE